MASVGVVIPAFNAARTIDRALASVMAQEVAPEAVVVVDDGSTDGTPSLVAERYPWVHLAVQPNGGPSRARNTGAALLHTAWIAFLDADDFWFPDKLRCQLGVSAAHPGATVVAGGWTRAEERREGGSGEVRTIDLPWLTVLSGYFLGPSGVIVRRDAFAEAGGFRPEMDGVEDRDLFSRMARAGEAYLVDRVVWHYASSPDSFSKRRMRGFRAGLALMAECRGDVERRYGKRAWEIILAGSLLRYRLYFRRDADPSGVADCDAHLQRISPAAVAWARRHLFLPQMARRAMARLLRNDTYRCEYLPTLRDLTGPDVPP